MLLIKEIEAKHYYGFKIKKNEETNAEKIILTKNPKYQYAGRGFGDRCKSNIGSERGTKNGNKSFLQ